VKLPTCVLYAQELNRTQTTAVTSKHGRHCYLLHDKFNGGIGGITLRKYVEEANYASVVGENKLMAKFCFLW
jgi:hypothetical protein